MKLFLILAIAMLLACATVPMANKDAEARSKTFAPREGAASLYIYRTSGFTGQAVKNTILVDGVWIGDLARSTYVHAIVPPGEHIVYVPAENAKSARIVAVAGASYFVKVIPKFGLVRPDVELDIVEAATAQNEVRACGLIDAVRPPPRPALPAAKDALPGSAANTPTVAPAAPAATP